MFDGTDSTTGCVTIDHIEWTYNSGLALYTAATMWNFTGGASTWEDRVTRLVTTGLGVFFSPFPNATNIMFEVACG